MIRQEQAIELSTAEPACHSTPEQAGLCVETVPFDQLPQQSRLFLDYLHDATALRPFYPEAVKHHYDLPGRRDRVLAKYQTDRTELCDALERLNRAWNASDKTLAHIECLRESDCIAVVSGQQAGLFGGPLYTIYKALSAIKLAECLTQRGVKAVPVFWIATEDHDFAEVATAEFTADLRKLLGEAYQRERKFGDAFACLMTRLTGGRGLILFDPLDLQLKH